MTANLRDCACGSSDVHVEHAAFGQLYVRCGKCGAEGKHFPVSAMVGKLWPREAAAKAWNAGEMEKLSRAGRT